MDIKQRLRIARVKDSGKIYLVRLVDWDHRRCRLWGEVVRATAHKRSHGPDLCLVPLDAVEISEVEMTAELHNSLVEQGIESLRATGKSVHQTPRGNYIVAA